MRTFSISWCRCFYCCCTNWLVPPFTAFCNKMCLINPYIILREWQTNIKELFLHQCIALLPHFCFPALIAFVRMWKCSGGRAGDHQRTIRPKWGQLPGQVVQILCPRPRPQYTRPIYKTNIQDQYTRPRPRPWKNYQTKVGSTALAGGPNTLPKTTIYTKILVTVQ